MKQKIFYSFDYDNDCVRTQMIRNIGIVEKERPISSNDWETIKKGGDKAIKNWIDEQLKKCNCTIVLIGRHTSKSKWVRYEIKKSWNDGKGLFGIYIHRLKNFDGEQSYKGSNPFNRIKIPWLFILEQKLSNKIKVYDPPHRDSKNVYKYIGDNIIEWIDEAISIRENN